MNIEKELQIFAIWMLALLMLVVYATSEILEKTAQEICEETNSAEVCFLQLNN